MVWLKFLKINRYKILLLGLVIIIIIFVCFKFLPARNKITIDFTDQTQLEKNRIVKRLIDGVEVPSDRANLFPVAVVIENLASSRPPSGLDRANLVDEFLVEGGITRFLAFFSSGENIEKIGPVRSIRPYVLDLTWDLQALLVHAGGSSQALYALEEKNLISLNQLSGNQAFFWRDDKRAAPHNLYTNTKFLALALRDKNLPSHGNFDPWYFKADAQQDGSSAINNIVINFSTYNYKVNYRYNKAENNYWRFQGGTPHNVETGQQITVKNIIIQFVKTKLIDDQHLDLSLIGEGEGLAFMDGNYQKIKWLKTEINKRTRFFTLADSGEILFNAGSTWIEIVPSDKLITYE